MKKKSTPFIWTIAGSDSSSGAGIQADLMVSRMLNVHAFTILTAVTAQSPATVFSTQSVSEPLLKDQIKAAAAAGIPSAIKTGMLCNEVTIRIVADALANSTAYKICDPVLVSSSGKPLLENADIPALANQLLPHIDLLTPNISEAALLSGITINTPDNMVMAAKKLLTLGPKAVLLKGGHADHAICRDYYCDNSGQHFWINSPRIPNGNALHGTGCAFSAAIAAGIALGFQPRDAIILARCCINRAIRIPSQLGETEYNILNHDGWPDDPADMPWVSPDAQSERFPTAFPNCGPEPLGIYPLVDSADWVERLVECGVTTIQLRLKNASASFVDAEIARAVKATRKSGCRLFINDYWEAAIRHGAYGVHLGQEDLDKADLHTIQQAGLRLGTSTHGFYELARVNAWRPSYAAMGTVFPSPSKPGLKKHLGTKTLARMTALCEAPAVAIGGILLDNAAKVIQTGISGIAVISDIKKAVNLNKQVASWQQLFRNVR